MKYDLVNYFLGNHTGPDQEVQARGDSIRYFSMLSFIGEDETVRFTSITLPWQNDHNGDCLIVKKELYNRLKDLCL